MIDLDDVDRSLLRALSLDGSLSAGELGRRFGLSQPAAWRRIKRLEEAGVIAGRRLDVDRTALGFGVTVFLGVKLATKGRVSLEDFERAVQAIPEVQVVQHVLGLFDYRLRVVARDTPSGVGCASKPSSSAPSLGAGRLPKVLPTKALKLVTPASSSSSRWPTVSSPSRPWMP